MTAPYKRSHLNDYYARKRHAKKRILEYCLVPALFWVVAVAIFSNDFSSSNAQRKETSRYRRAANTIVDNSTEKLEKECTPPTIEEFPSDLFSNKSRLKGALSVHAFLAVYMFLALAVICDDYFVSSLEHICEQFSMSEDVAGATFMAAGSSAPELFASIIGVFVAKGDVGIGTIVGSAVFNILCIIGICGLLAGQVVELTKWPLCRDSLYYAIAVGSLIYTLFDGKVDWFEAGGMLVFYSGYITILRFNKQLQSLFGVTIKEKSTETPEGELPNNNAPSTDVGGLVLQTVVTPNQKTLLEHNNFPNGNSEQPPKVTEEVECPDDTGVLIQPIPKLTNFADVSLRIMLSRSFRPSARMRAASRLIISEMRRMKEKSCNNNVIVSVVTSKTIESLNEIYPNNKEAIIATPDIPSTLCVKPDGILAWLKFILLLPLLILLHLTVPDCRRPKWERWYPITFLNSVLWIAICSYFLVWMVTIIGYTLRIPDTIMGITFLAAGTSVPDCMASLFVARQGLGDMAVSNSIGSNVFDILFGLALPWFIKTTIWHQSIKINSNGLLYSSILLFFSVAFTIAAIHTNGWKLNKCLGGLFLLCYSVYIVIACCIEFNLFGYVNPPICTS